jgi:hypothetical protein
MGKRTSVHSVAAGKNDGIRLAKAGASKHAEARYDVNVSFFSMPRVTQR